VLLCLLPLYCRLIADIRHLLQGRVRR
jgi:hypothetical protein